jgi:hypothetical protein
LSYLPCERETTLQIDDESNVWVLETRQNKIKTKLSRIGVTPVKEYPDGGAKYILDYEQVSFRQKSKPRNLSEEQRQAAAERLAKARSKKNKKGEDDN